MDPLSDVLHAVRLSGAYFYLVEAAAPWSVPTAPARELVPRVLPTAEHLISYHILLSGSCWAGVEGESQVQLLPGDVIVFPHGHPHLMSSANGFRVDPRREAPADRYPETVLLGPENARDTSFVCGFLGCDLRPFNPLITSLPSQLYLRGADCAWISNFARHVLAETRAGRAGREMMLTRMAELMFVEVLRNYVERAPHAQTGWLAGLVDPVVGPALTKLHEIPGRAWTLADLARESNASRSVLVERFARTVGIPPMLYLKRWRLQLAAEQLARGTAKVASVGAQVGYDSEAAFSRAFKQETGMSPAAWRRGAATP